MTIDPTQRAGDIDVATAAGSARAHNHQADAPRAWFIVLEREVL